MIISVIKEIKNNENRVGLTPAGSEALVRAGHTVKVLLPDLQHIPSILYGFSWPSKPLQSDSAPNVQCMETALWCITVQRKPVHRQS